MTTQANDLWKMPVLELGEVEAVSPDGTEGVCYDEAIIFFKDQDGENSIDVECPAAVRVATFIVNASNNHDALVAELKRLFELYGHQATADVLRLVEQQSR